MIRFLLIYGLIGIGVGTSIVDGAHVSPNTGLVYAAIWPAIIGVDLVAFGISQNVKFK